MYDEGVQFGLYIYYSGRQIICTTALVIFTPIAQNYENKNIFFFKIRILHEKCDLSVLTESQMNFRVKSY